MKHDPPRTIVAQSDLSELSPRTRLLLHGPIVPTLLRMAWPNVLVMLAQASTGLIETWWVSHLGTAALTGMAVVFPGFMMMQMLSAGAVGGLALAQGSARGAIVSCAKMLLKTGIPSAGQPVPVSGSHCGEE